MRVVRLPLVMLCIIPLLGCIGGGPKLQWSENIAVFADSKDSKLNDDNIHSVGETSPLIEEAKDTDSQMEADRYTQALLEWGKPQKVQRIIIKADEGELEFFDVQYWTDEGAWKLLRSVKNHIRLEYKLQMKEPITTKKIRLKVPRQWDSRRVGGQKRATRGETGAPTGSYKKIREIEVYYALPSAAAAATQ
jgi:hypothetical protein